MRYPGDPVEKNMDRITPQTGDYTQVICNWRYWHPSSSFPWITPGRGPHSCDVDRGPNIRTGFYTNKESVYTFGSRSVPHLLEGFLCFTLSTLNLGSDTGRRYVVLSLSPVSIDKISFWTMSSLRWPLFSGTEKTKLDDPTRCLTSRPLVDRRPVLSGLGESVLESPLPTRSSLHIPPLPLFLVSRRLKPHSSLSV